MCPKNGTIFMLRVPGMGLFIFLYWYMFIWTMILIWLKVPLVGYFLFVWWGFFSELFLYFNDRGFYINAGSGILGWMTLV